MKRAVQLFNGLDIWFWLAHQIGMPRVEQQFPFEDIPVWKYGQRKWALIQRRDFPVRAHLDKPEQVFCAVVQVG